MANDMTMSTASASGQAGMRAQETDGTIRVPVVEEQLEVEKRAGQIGEVGIEKRTIEEQVSVPVELRREELHVEERDVTDRPISPEEAERIFAEGTIRVPVRGEEAVVTKEAVVTGEVVVGKEQTVERQEITDTVRRMEVDVDENYDRIRGGFEQHFTNQQAGGTRSFEQAEPNYQLGYTAAMDERYAGKTFDEVEPALRQQYERRSNGRGSAWEHLRAEARTGYEAARGQSTAGEPERQRRSEAPATSTDGDGWERLRTEIREG